MFNESLTWLSVISYDKYCVDFYKTMLPYSFSWTGESWVSYWNGNSNGDGYDEEYCYAYGTTVVRRTSEEKNETVPIEEV